MFKILGLTLISIISVCVTSNSIFNTSYIDSNIVDKDNSDEASLSSYSYEELKHESVDSFAEDNAEKVVFYKEIIDLYGNAYDLYEMTPKGYAIYAKSEESSAFLEGSHSNYSPYHDFLGSELYYLGVGNYYYKKGNDIINIMTGDPLENIEEITEESHSLSNDIFLVNEDIKDETLLDDISSEDAFFDNSNNEIKDSSSMSRDTFLDTDEDSDFGYFSKDVVTKELDYDDYSLNDDLLNESEINTYRFVTVDGSTGSSSGSSSGSTSSGSSSSSNTSSSSGQTSTSISDLAVEYNGFTCIKDYEYFKNLKYFPSQSKDYKGTCGVVAICILLGYLDEYYNSEYIPSSKESDYKDHNGTSQGLYEKIVEEYLHYNNFYSAICGGYPMTFIHIRNTLKDYLKGECTSELKKDSKLARFAVFNTHNGIRKKIDKGIPVITTMLFYDYSNSDKVVTGEEPHTVVAYGYNKSDDTFLVHFGWSSGSTSYSETIISGATIYSWNTCEYQGE